MNTFSIVLRCRFIVFVFLISFFCLHKMQAQSEKHTIKFTLLKTKYDTTITPAIWYYTNLDHTDSAIYENNIEKININKYQIFDTVFSSVSIKVFTDTNSAPILSFGPILKQNLAFTNSEGSGEFTLTGLTASRNIHFARLYVDSRTDYSHQEQFTISSFPPIPIGTVMPYIMNTSLQLEVSGWFVCDGRFIPSLSHLTNDEKNALISLLNASGNPNYGSYLPDMRGYFLRGVDGGSGNDPDHASRGGLGNKLGGVQNDEYKIHNHTGILSAHYHTGTTDSIGNHNHGGFTGASRMNDDSEYANFAWEGRSDLTSGGGSNAAKNSFINHKHPINTGGAHKHTFTTSGPIGDPLVIQYSGGYETRPKNIGVNYIIKAR